jgi:SAM-dependent methyltransferase
VIFGEDDVNATSAEYVFGGDQNELQRLLAQAEDLKPESTWLLDSLGIAPGWRVADIGCGPIGVLDILSDRVGPAGVVIGIEREARFADMARRQIERRGLKNTSIAECDLLSEQLGKASFDLVHERLVLLNVPQANQLSIVTQMISLARPGGVIAVENWDRASYACYPEHPSWRVLNDAFADAIRPTNGEGTTGRTLPWLLRQAGATDIDAKVHVRLLKVGDLRRTHRLGLLDVTKAKILATGRLSEAEFDAHRRTYEEILADPDVLIIGQTLVQAWGRRPS